MAKVLPSKELQRRIGSEMLINGEYTFSQIFMIYEEIMRCDLFISEYKKMSASSLQRRLDDWSSVECSWLIKKGAGKNATYYKRCCKRNDFSMYGWKKLAEDLLSKSKKICRI